VSERLTLVEYQLAEDAARADAGLVGHDLEPLPDAWLAPAHGVDPAALTGVAGALWQTVFDLRAAIDIDVYVHDPDAAAVREDAIIVGRLGSLLAYVTAMASYWGLGLEDVARRHLDALAASHEASQGEGAGNPGDGGTAR